MESEEDEIRFAGVPRSPDPRRKWGDENAPGVAPASSIQRQAHVLFLDVVGYSKLPMATQAALQTTLQQLVLSTAAVRAARSSGSTSRDIIFRPTGDGMAILFFTDEQEPLRCAVEISLRMRREAAALQREAGTFFALRMGVHSGPVLVVTDLNGQADVAGDGINLGQRVMDCGDAGHILVSDVVAQSVRTQEPWSRWLNRIGTVRVKHGVPVSLYSLHGFSEHGETIGNELLPRKVGAERRTTHADRYNFDHKMERLENEDRSRPYLRSLAALLVTGALLLGGFLCARRYSPDLIREVAGSAKRASESVTRAVSRTRTTPVRAEASLPSDTTETRHTAPSHEREPASVSDVVGLLPVPELRGMTETQARQVIKGLGFKPKVVYGVPDNDADWQAFPAGRVFRQFPEAGEGRVPGSANGFVRIRIRHDAERNGEQRAVSGNAGNTTNAPAISREAPSVSAEFSGVILDLHAFPTHPTSERLRLRTGDDPLFPEGAEPTVTYVESREAANALAGSQPLLLQPNSIDAPHGVLSGAGLSRAESRRLQEADGPEHRLTSGANGIIVVRPAQ